MNTHKIRRFILSGMLTVSSCIHSLSPIDFSTLLASMANLSDNIERMCSLANGRIYHEPQQKDLYKKKSRLTCLINIMSFQKTFSGEALSSRTVLRQLSVNRELAASADGGYLQADVLICRFVCGRSLASPGSTTLTPEVSGGSC